jgi:hypothetical protein
MAQTKEPRKRTPSEVELSVLERSCRRCALCFHLDGDLSEKLGQLAHLDGDRVNSAEDNLAFLCLEHHSLYDSKTSQHKNYTIEEVKRARTNLYEATAQGKHVVPSRHPPEKDLAEFVSKYRQRMRGMYSHWELSSLWGNYLINGKAVAVTLDQIYLPPCFAPEESQAPGARAENATSVDVVLAQEQRLIIRGPGGAGKTTWLRWTFQTLIENEAAFPIMLEVRHLVRHWSAVGTAHAKDRSLDSFLDTRIVENLDGWSGYLEVLLNDPNCPKPVLLVDGWDEMGELGDELRGKLAGFAESHPRISILVTSRPYGMAQPSLATGYQVFDIQPLRDDEIFRFCETFCRLFYPGDVSRAEELVRGLRQSTDALALARSPLLLTIILRVHRSGPLPEKRHLLYKHCVRELLADYPDAKVASGAELLPVQWCPETYDERLQAAAHLAYEIQHLGYAPNPRRLVERDLIVRSREELIDVLPSSWSLDKRNGYLEWLAGPAGLMVHHL